MANVAYLAGVAARANGRLNHAIGWYRRAIALNPMQAVFHGDLGIALHEAGEVDQAVAELLEALRLDPASAEAHNNLGYLHLLGKRPQIAEPFFRKAIELQPGFALAHGNLGVVLARLDRLTEAEAILARTVQLDPNQFDALRNLAAVWQRQGKYNEAINCWQRVIELRPDLHEACCDLANLLLLQQRSIDAETCLRRALVLSPDNPCYLARQGVALKDQGRSDDAIAALQAARARQPALWAAGFDLVDVLIDAGRVEEASETFLAVCGQVVPDNTFSSEAVPLLPVIPASVDEIEKWRARFAAAIEQLKGLPLGKPELVERLLPRFFYLAYHSCPNRDLMCALSATLRQTTPALNFVSRHVREWTPPDERQRIRIGFLSHLLVRHTVGHLFAGMIKQIDRQRFSVVLIYPPSAKQDLLRAEISACADEEITLPGGFSDQLSVLEEARLDVLFYPDIGMAASTYCLAHARLAPVQVVGWGHPETTGVDTLDYFVSSTLIENESAQEHYSEHLVCLDRLPCYYEPDAGAVDMLTRAELGLPEQGVLYGCPQSLFKLHPDFDAVLAEIAELDPSGTIVLVAGKTPSWVELLKARWARTFPVLLERVRFLPALPRPRFVAMLAYMDVLLDPLYFGSGNTLYEAFQVGTPIVTWPGVHMRGRIVAGAYRQIGIPDAPVVHNVREYAGRAYAVARDSSWRQRIMDAAAKPSGLFNDLAAVRELEAFFATAVQEAGSATRLSRASAT